MTVFKLAAAGLLAVSLLTLPASASTKAEDCKGMLYAGGQLIKIGNDLNDLYKKFRDDPNNKDRGEAMNAIRGAFNSVQSAFYALRVDYSTPPPCGSGDFERDLGDKFPTLDKMRG